MKTKTLPNIHTGEILLEEFLLPMNVSQNALARDRRAAAAHQ
jgi:antitoxin HigA-1